MMTKKTWLTLSLLALPLAGCSLLIDSGDYTGGEPDAGTGDTGTMDTGTTDTGTTDSDVPPGCDPACPPDQRCVDHGDGTSSCEPGMCVTCGAGEIMFDTGHCIPEPTCTVTCAAGQVCDPFDPGFCFTPPPCPSTLPEGIECGAYGPVPTCACAEGTSRPDPFGPAVCAPCARGDHYVASFGACVPGSVRCTSDADCTVPGETCGIRFPGDDMYCANDGGGGCLAPMTICPDGSCVDVTIDPMHCGDCTISCAAGDACVDGSCTSPPPVGCDCASGEVCVDGGACLPLGSCDAIPTPTCASGGSGGTLQSLRVLSADFTTAAERRDFHITANVDGNGWMFFWRDEVGGIYSAFAHVFSDSAGGTCYTAADLGQVTTGADAPNVAHLDARTIYLGTAGAPVTAIATAAGTTAAPVMDVWRPMVTTDGMGDPVHVSLTRIIGIDNSTSNFGLIDGLSIVPVGPGIDLRAAMGREVVSYTDSGAWTHQAASVDLSGKVAAAPFSSLFGIVGDRRVLQWDGSFGTSGFTRRDAPMGTTIDGSLVAAVNPEDLLQEHFVFGRSDGGIQELHCGAGTCMSDPLLMSVPRDPSTPVAAYAVTEIGGATESITVFAVERSFAGDGLDVVRRTTMTDPMPVLTGDTVGGKINDVLALDAEAVAAPGGASFGWDYVWAAFVVVDRSGAQSLELWTGAERVCR